MLRTFALDPRTRRARFVRAFLVVVVVACCGLVPAQAPPDPPAAEDEDAPALRVAWDAASSSVVAQRDGEEGWRTALRPAGVEALAPVRRDDQVVVAHGSYLVFLDAATGEVLRRAALPAAAEALRRGDDGLVVEVVHATGRTESLPIGADGPATPVRFGTDPRTFDQLRTAAAEIDDAATAWARDPTQPWLALAASRTASDPAEAEDLRADAVDAAAALPFFESFGIGAALAQEGHEEAAADAMEAALSDFAARGYDPRLATDPALRTAYGFTAFGRAVADGDLGTARILAPYAWRLAAQTAPGTVAELEAFADLLRERGDGEAAAVWRERARTFERAGVATWVDRAALSLGRFGHGGAVALGTGLLLAWLTLLAKVWRAQTLARKQRRERGQSTPALARAWVPRHLGTPEKLALLGVLALAGLMAVLGGWADRGEDLPPALASGTLASVPAVDAVEALPDTPYAAFARGTSLATRGEVEAALRELDRAGEIAPALVNRAVLTGDASLLTAALEADPRDPVVRHHLSEAANPSPFHERYRQDDPLLAVPTPYTFALAAAGDWRDALAGAFTAPWRSSAQARPAGVPPPAWWAFLAACATLFVALVVNLPIPRPRVSKRAPRTPAYHVLALLVPGSGHLDELWGLLLLVPGSILAGDVVRQWAGAPGALGLGLRTEVWILAAILVLNAAGFAVEVASYRRRMRALREEKPDLARSYGLDLPPRDPEA